MNLKKFILLIIALILFQAIIPALSEDRDSPEEIRASAKEIAQRFMPYYKSLKSCTPYNNDELAIVYGEKDNQCHFRLNRYDCKTPKIISWQYGKISYDTLKKMQDNKQDVNSIKKQAKYIKEMEKNIVKDYCTHIKRN